MCPVQLAHLLTIKRMAFLWQFTDYFLVVVKTGTPLVEEMELSLVLLLVVYCLFRPVAVKPLTLVHIMPCP